MLLLAREIQQYGNPVKPTLCNFKLRRGNNTYNRQQNNKGHGGPSQELTASFAIAAEKAPGACMYSMDSEGTDGTTPVAGGITDSTTADLAKKDRC